MPHNKPTLGHEEQNAACRAIQSGWVAQGTEVEQFERELCAYLGLPANHAVALSSGTAALFMALWALRAKGKTIALPVYACSALRNAAALIGAKEFVVDTAENSANIDLSTVIKSAAELAIVPHLFGIPVDIPNMGTMDIIEDCAQALGATVNGKCVGLTGRAAIFSFFATKLITSGGQGGMFVSTDRSLVDSVRDYREFDQRRDKQIRFNFQMTDIQAAVGREQLKKLPAFLKRRNDIFSLYRDAGIPLFDIEDKTGNKLIPVRYRAVMRTSSPRDIIASLQREGIKSIVPIEDWELLGDPEAFPLAAKMTRESVSLPLYPTLSDKDVAKIIRVVLNR